MKYKIYQITNYNDCDYKFEWWDWAKEKFNFERDYSLVYEGEIELETDPILTLEKLFEIFNINHPADFRGHSLSVSDVVELDGIKYYCDSQGWVKLN
jgi:hypothetical protein